MITALLQIPAWRFRAEIDTKEQGDDGKEGRTEFKPPSDIPNPLQCQVGTEPKEDTKGDPHLPAHNEATSNRGRDVFRGKNGDGGCFRAHADAEQQTADKKLFPGLAETGADDGKETEDGTEEDGATTSDVEIEWIGKPAPAIEKRQQKNHWETGLSKTYHKAAAMYGAAFTKPTIQLFLS